MKKEVRTIVYDEELRLEAYHFEGIVQPADVILQKQGVCH